jgi:hypothetical protein
MLLLLFYIPPLQIINFVLLIIAEIYPVCSITAVCPQAKQGKIATNDKIKILFFIKIKV